MFLLQIENQRREELNRIKIANYWIKKKKQLTDERGVWQIEKRQAGLTRYKYGKIEDSIGRRMRLKIDKIASRLVYLTKDTFEEVMKSQRKPSTNSPDFKMTSTLYDLSPKFQFLDQSVNFADFTSSTVSMNPLSLVRQNSKTTNPASKSPESHRKETSDFYVEDIKQEKVADGGRDDSFSDSDIRFQEKENLIKSTSTGVDSASIPKKRREKTKTFECERITLKGAIWGEIEIPERENYFIFRPLSGERPDTDLFELGAMKHSFITSTKKKAWNFQKIRHIHQRRYHYIKSAFEIFTSDNKSYYFNLYSPTNLKQVLSEFKLRSKDIQIYSRENFPEPDLTKRWVEGRISNFEYLMQLNICAGRSFNDLSQYPIFPWIIADYKSEELNIHTRNEAEQKKIFRDLSLPLGAMTEEKRKELRNRVLDMMDLTEEEAETLDKEKFELRLKAVATFPDNDVFMHGTHYSTGGHIIDYLVRLEPFTSLQIKLQGGMFDEANRIFSSIPKAWEIYLLPHNSQTSKELVPEFFYCPNFLKNK